MIREGFLKEEAFKQITKGKKEPAKGRAGGILSQAGERCMQSLEGKGTLDMFWACAAQLGATLSHQCLESF